MWQVNFFFIQFPRKAIKSLKPLDCNTGTHSIYTEFSGYEIMFHVSTFLPFSKSNAQQVLIFSSSHFNSKNLFSMTSFSFLLFLLACPFAFDPARKKEAHWK